MKQRSMWICMSLAAAAGCGGTELGEAVGFSELAASAAVARPGVLRESDTSATVPTPGALEESEISEISGTSETAAVRTPGVLEESELSEAPQTSETSAETAAQLSLFNTPRRDDGPGDAPSSLNANPNHMLGGGVITNTRNRGARPQHWEPGWEFRQTLHVYSMHAFRTGWDHSGSITFTYRRPAGSDAAWELYRRTLTCNHGTCPELDPQMKLRYVCDPQVVIAGWWGEDGECSGDWGPYGWNHRHLCNDDLALQINNAFGRWSGDHCANKGRGITPRCQPHWG